MFVDQPDHSSFGFWLLNALGNRDLSGSSLARRMRVPMERVASWLTAGTAPDDEDLPALAEALDVKIAELRRALLRR